MIQGYCYEEKNEKADAGNVVHDCILCNHNFDNPNSALKVYREARKRILTTKMAVPRIQIKTEKANYKFYSLTAADCFSVTVYVKNTAIYAYCNAENRSTITGILDAIGYVKTKAD